MQGPLITSPSNQTKFSGGFKIPLKKDLNLKMNSEAAKMASDSNWRLSGRQEFNI